MESPLSGDGSEQSGESENGNENVEPVVNIRQTSRRQGAKPVTNDENGAESDETGANANKKRAEADDKRKPSGEEESEDKEKKAKVLEFKKFDIPELDCIFGDFKTTFDPFVQNREEMSKAEGSFKKAVMSLGQISPRAKFGDYVAALKTRLKTEGIIVKVKEGAATIYQEGKKTVKGISDAVDAINAMLKLAKDLKAMPLTIASGSEDAVERAEELDVQGILKRELKSMWDLGKIPKLKRAFSNNVKQVKRAPEMVRDFCHKIKEIILEIYHAFADEEDQRKMEEQLSEGDDTAKDQKKKEEGASGKSDSKKKSKNEKDKKDKDKEEFHKKLKFESVGLDDIDNVFTSLASAINPFVETRERVQAARESFENIVKSICNIDVKKELKDYIKELKKDAKEGNITIYIDDTDGEIKVKSIKGVKPPKLYRDAVQALRNLKSAGSETVELEPDVQHGIGECFERVMQINPQRDFHNLLKKKSDVFTLPGKIKKFNDNRKKAQEIPGIVKEFCLYVKRLLTDILEALTGEEDADTADKKDEDSGEEGNKSSAGEYEPAGKEDVVSDKDEDKSDEDGPVNKNDEESGKGGEEKTAAGKDEPVEKENQVRGEALDD